MIPTASQGTRELIPTCETIRVNTNQGIRQHVLLCSDDHAPSSVILSLLRKQVQQNASSSLQYLLPRSLSLALTKPLPADRIAQRAYLL